MKRENPKLPKLKWNGETWNKLKKGENTKTVKNLNQLGKTEMHPNQMGNPDMNCENPKCNRIE